VRTFFDIEYLMSGDGLLVGNCQQTAFVQLISTSEAKKGERTATPGEVRPCKGQVIREWEKEQLLFPKSPKK
jgi:hypothetical protein